MLETGNRFSFVAVSLSTDCDCTGCVDDDHADASNDDIHDDVIMMMMILSFLPTLLFLLTG